MIQYEMTVLALSTTVGRIQSTYLTAAQQSPKPLTEVVHPCVRHGLGCRVLGDGNRD